MGLPSSAVSQIISAIPGIETSISNYASSVVESPDFLIISYEIDLFAPSSARDQLASAPALFIISVVEAPVWPTWITDIPIDASSYLDDVNERVQSIFDQDLQTDSEPTTTPTEFQPSNGSRKSPTPPSTKFVYPSSTSVTTSAGSGSETITTKPTPTSTSNFGTNTVVVSLKSGSANTASRLRWGSMGVAALVMIVAGASFFFNHDGLI